MNIHNAAAKKVRFFDNADKSFISNIVPHLLYKTYKEKTFLYKKGEYADEIYFIISGKVVFVYGHQNHVFKTML